MSEADTHAAALSDPDAQPLTEAQLKRARRVPNVTRIAPSLASRKRSSLHASGCHSERFGIGSRVRIGPTGRPRYCYA